MTEEKASNRPIIVESVRNDVRLKLDVKKGLVVKVYDRVPMWYGHMEKVDVKGMTQCT